MDVHKNPVHFLQLNQNFKLNEWNNNILNTHVLKDLHNMFCSETEQIDIIHRIYNVSQEYNIDKKHLLQSFFNYIIRNTNIEINDEFILYMKKIIHSINSNMMDTIRYMIINRDKLKPVPYGALDSP